MSIRRMVGGVTAAALALTISVVVVPAAHAGSGVPGSYQVVTSQRLLDTRTGLGAPLKAVAPGATLTFVAAPASLGSVAAVALTVTAVNPSRGGFLTVWAAGTTKPRASILDFAAHQTVPNMVVSPVGAGGKVSIFNGSSGTVNLLADIHGYFVGGANAGDAGTLVPMAPTRFLDTRNGTGAPKKQVGAFGVVKVKIAGVHGVPADASSVVVNVTAVSNTGQGYITAYPGEPAPLASLIDYRAHESRANLALLAIGTDGTISLRNGSNVAVDLVADVSGYFVGGDPSADGTFVPSTPVRVFDSRGPGGHPAAALTTSKICVLPDITNDPPTCGTNPLFSIFSSIVVTVTAVNPQASGFLTTWDGVGPIPSVSSSNFVPGSSYAGSLILPINPDGTISIYNGSFGNVDLIVDITGYIVTPSNLNITPTRSTASKSAQALQSMSPSARVAAAVAKMAHAPSSAVPVKVTR